jgi:hypothetical protein
LKYKQPAETTNKTKTMLKSIGIAIGGAAIGVPIIGVAGAAIGLMGAGAAIGLIARGIITRRTAALLPLLLL